MLDFFAELSRNARAYPHSLALISKRGNLEYHSLVEIIESIAGYALDERLTGGGRIVHVDTDNDDMRLLLFLGLMRAGMTVAILQSVGRAFVETGVTPDVVVTDRSEKSVIGQRAGRVVRFSSAWFRPDRQARQRLPESPQFALLFASSGSTGRQKLILENHLNSQSNMLRKQNSAIYQDYIRLITGIGPTSHGSFPECMLTLFNGGSIIRLERYTPDEIVGATALLQPSYAKIAPKTLVEILSVLEAEPRRFEKIEYVSLGGAYCDVATRRSALDKFAQRIFTTYGSTEVGRIAHGDFADIGGTEGSVGWLAEGMMAETVDDAGRPLPIGAEGELRIKPPTEAAARYLTKDGLVDVLQDGWYYPGDIGRLDPSGQLIITGRKSAVINVGGNKINPEVAEGILRGLDDVDDVAVAGVVGDHGFQEICALIATTAPIDLDAINRSLAEKGARFSVQRLKVVPEIPRNPNRKIDRPAVQEIAKSD